MASTSGAVGWSSLALPSSLRQTVEPSTAHDIFLSHSGAQKQFVKDLYKELSQNFSTFFDITYHSLPLGENFPKRIFSAARTCKVAAVILSEEFVCSKWPMLELSAFVDALPTVKILPLFFKLSPLDLKNRVNFKRWGKKWKAIAKQDPRIVVSKWENALRVLGSHNGLTFNAAAESELTYLERIVSGISQIVPPAIKYDACHVQGKDRLCQVILDKFKEMDCHEILQHDSLALPISTNLPLAVRAKVLSLYGLPGSGKSTLCKILRDRFFPIYAGKSLYMELPTNPSLKDLVDKFKLLLRFTDFRDRIDLNEVSELEEVEWLLRIYRLQSCSVFLVVDNISDKSWAAAQRILLVGFGLGSKIVLVARTLDILLPVLKSLKSGHHCICDSMCIPNVDEREAKEILVQTTRTGGVDLDGYIPQQHLTPEQTEIVLRIVRLCGFGPKNSQVYLPSVMKIVGGMLIKYKGDLEEWGSDQERFWAGVKNYKEDAVKELVEESSMKYVAY